MLTIEQRAELYAVMRRRHGNAALARRARCVVLWSDGQRRVDIRSKLACNDELVSKWTAAFEAQGLAGLVSLHPGRAPRTPVAKLDARVLNRTLKHLPKDGSTHWSSRKLAAELGDVSFSAVQKWTRGCCRGTETSVVAIEFSEKDLQGAPLLLHEIISIVVTCLHATQPVRLKMPSCHLAHLRL